MTDYKPQGRGTATPRRREGADLSARKIIVTATLLILFLAATHFGLKRLMDQFATQEGNSGGTSGTVPLAVGAQIPPAPRLQADPEKEMDTLKSQQRQWVDSYGWVNTAHTTARIPIEQAKAMLLQHGLPSVAFPAAPSPEASQRPSPLQAPKAKGTANVR